MSKKQRRLNPKVAFHLHRWHRRLGVISCLFLVLLSITGFLLQHSTEFGFEKKNVSSDWLINYYGIGYPKINSNYAVNGKTISQTEDLLFINDKAAGQTYGKLVGAVDYDDFLLVFFEFKYSIFTAQLELVDNIDYPSEVELPITQVSNQPKPAIFQAANGIFQLQPDLSSVNPIQFVLAPPWQQQSQLPAERAESIIHYVRQQSLTYERITLDLHSGRLFGPIGPYIMDFMALLFMILAISGIWLWSRKRRW
ncbi:MAG: PepSY domain-containing protein [Gammaproteobacteria bacterium]|nr:PepSY domain-containing protein [Gammaproteobacteria bacterium]NVK88058.1 PepSY domain-containing protein [Gammaproteobacteria bacterium]